MLNEVETKTVLMYTLATMSVKKFLILPVVAVLSIVLAGCKPVETTQLSGADNLSPTAVASDSATGKLKANYEFVATESGLVALELLEDSAAIETKDFGTAGKFVTSINGLSGNNEYYWAFYLNSEYAEQGISQTTLNKGDVINFVYEAVSITK